MSSQPESDPAESDPAKSLFLAALDLRDEEREEFLVSRCGADRELRSRVDALLAAHDRAPSFLSEPRESGQDSESAGSFIGRYKLLQPIGEGGFGSVWMAEQQEPVHRMVALKIIKLGMDTRQVVARFEAERQALALMDHPNIAKVLDGGATENGRPFFVMELVRGVPITEYCDQARLSTRQRLELFVLVCKAVQHAHQKGIIHRDIKPSNVLVTLHDGSPVPKVIDFGIAKATSGRLTEKTLFTEFRQFVGTPEYMSPEQAGISGLDIDTRADIYSLGVLLYELLTGTTPVNPTSLREAAYEEILRLIREVDPPRPSQRVSTLGERQVTVARQRGTEPGLLRRLVRGDLDWIAMKALEKDRTRRYETAASLGLDVDRYLAHEPIAARPPSGAYRLRKFARRHRGGVLAGSLVAAALIVGTGLATLGFVEARAERDNALDAESRAQAEATKARAAEGRALEEAQNARSAEMREREQRERADASASHAQEEAAAAAAINAFYDEMLLAIDPLRLRHRSAFSTTENVAHATAAGLARDLSVAEMLQGAGAKIEASFAGKPELEAKVRETIGVTLLGLGLPGQALGQLEPALALHESLGDLQAPDALRVRLLVGAARSVQGDNQAAETLVREALQGMHRVHGPESPRTLHAATLLSDVLTSRGEYEEARQLLLETLALQRRVLGSEHRDTVDTLCKLGCLHFWQNEPLAAEPYVREAFEIAERTLSPDDIVRVEVECGLGMLSEFLMDYARGEELLRSALVKLRRIVGDDHTSTYVAQNHLARCLQGETYREEREELLRSSIEGLMRLEDAPPLLFVARRDLALMLFERGANEEALALIRGSIEDRRRVDGPDHPRTQEAIGFLRDGLRRSGRFEEAEEAYRDLVRLHEDSFGPDSLRTCAALGDLTRFLVSCGKYDDAGADWQSILDLRRRLSERPGAGAQAHYAYGSFLMRPMVPGMRDLEGAIAAFHRVLELRSSHAAALQDLTIAYELSGRYEEAQRWARRVLEKEGAEHIEALGVMAQACYVAGRHEEALEWGIRLIEASAEKNDHEHPWALLEHAELLLTHVVPELRDPAGAVHYASRAAELRGESPGVLLTLEHALKADGDLERARKVAARRIALYAQTGARPQASAQELNSYLWALVTTEFPELREPELIEASLERLAEFARGDVSMLNTLGCAQFRAGHFEDALATLEESDRMNAGVVYNRAVDLLPMALCHLRLGDASPAQEILDACEPLLDDPELSYRETQEHSAFAREAQELLELLEE